MRQDYDGSLSSTGFSPAKILGFGHDDPTGKDLSWIGDFSDELAVAIVTRTFEDATTLVEKGELEMLGQRDSRGVLSVRES